MENKKMNIYPIIIGLVLIIIGLILRVPGGALTTYEGLDGAKTEYYTFDDRYSAIDEYVGGDAYNYIIGASLVAGKIAGTIAAKAICMVGGAICVCIGTIVGSSNKQTVIPEENHNSIAEMVQTSNELVSEGEEIK